MYKNDLWCGYCGTQDFTEHPNSQHPDDRRWSHWECVHCHALYEDNSGYGYFTLHWGDNDLETSGLGRFCLNSGSLIDESKPPRTPEGIVRHSGSREELERYLQATQIK